MSEFPLHAGHPALAREAVRDLRFSAIRDVANAGIGRDDILPFWFDEPALREALAHSLSRLHQPVSAERIVVTSSGVSALMLTAQALYSPGDRVVVVTPVWPNLVEIPRILGAQVEEVALELRPDEQGIARWHLSPETLLHALTPDYRALVINSLNNPSGWVMPAAQQAQILAHCRRHGIWIVSDEVYSRIVYDGPPDRCAPSFLDIADPNDRLVVINSFSKSWLMTGWRLGWVVAPPALMHELGKLIEYNSSCAPGFVQKAGLVAVNQGEALRQKTVTRFQASRDYLYQRFGSLADVEVPLPQGAMYLFFRVHGLNDSLTFCKALVAEAGVELAPGSVFGEAGESCLRWCIASASEKLEQGAGIRRPERLTRAANRGSHSISSPR